MEDDLEMFLSSKDSISNNCGEKNLWCSVIIQAINDCVGFKLDRSNGLNKRRAFNWIKDGGRDFQKVCEFAGHDHIELRQRILDYLANPACRHINYVIH